VRRREQVLLDRLIERQIDYGHTADAIAAFGGVFVS
jgi:hypothetical protein